MLRVIRRVLFLGMLAVAYTSEAQDCGALPERNCGYIIAAVSTWNERLDSRTRITNWEYRALGPTDVESLIDMLDDVHDVLSVGDADSESPVSIFSNLSTEDSDQLRNAERRFFRDHLRVEHTAVHLVNLHWSASDRNFTSTLIASDNYPYLYERILSSVVLVDDANSCVYKRLRWIFGPTRGEISIDLVPHNGRNFTCERTHYGRMSFGNVETKMSTPEYHDRRCVSYGAWAYATPLASMSFDMDMFSFTVSGIGSKGAGGRDCIAERN